jgi:hypothetical protein
MACGRAGVLPYVEITPEGFEDIDCRDVEGNRAFVQVKEVGAGAGKLTATDIADVLTHAAGAAAKNAPIILVTDGDLGSGLRFTGWEVSLAHQGGQGVDDVVAHLSNRGMLADQALSIVDRTHIVNLPWNIRPETERLIAQALDTHPTVASLALSHLYDAVTASSANQRATTAASAITHAVGDLDVIVRGIQEAVDMTGLDTAIAAGICEPADYANGSELTSVQFFAGVDGSPGHVSAHLDVIRPKDPRLINTRVV